MVDVREFASVDKPLSRASRSARMSLTFRGEDPSFCDCLLRLRLAATGDLGCHITGGTKLKLPAEECFPCQPASKLPVVELLDSSVSVMDKVRDITCGLIVTGSVVLWADMNDGWYDNTLLDAMEEEDQLRFSSESPVRPCSTSLLKPAKQADSTLMVLDDVLIQAPCATVGATTVARVANNGLAGT